jgi:hypothetical protein
VDITESSSGNSSVAAPGQQRRVDHCIGVQRENIVEAVGRGHAHRRCADDLADILAALGFRMHPAAGEFQFGVLEHALDRGHTDRPRCPLNDPQAHNRVPFSLALR